MYVDFHIHTRHSDGGKTVEEILDICKDKKIDYISITDHNSFEAYKQNINTNIKILKGIEIYVRYKKIILHMLLYNFDINCDSIKKYSEKNRRHDIKSFKLMIKELKEKHNVIINKKAVQKFVNNDSYFDKTRLNDLLVNCHLCGTPSEAFYKYTQNVKEYSKMNITMRELFSMEKDSKGIVSLAHPLNYGLDINFIKKLILEIKTGFNLRVVEAINNKQTKKQEKELIKFCKENKLYISAGSDAHYKFGTVSNKVVGKIRNKKIKASDVTFLELL